MAMPRKDTEENLSDLDIAEDEESAGTLTQ